MTEKQSKELLNRACDIITALEGFIGYNDGDYYNSDLAKSVDNLFDEVDMLKEAEMYKDTDPDLVQLERGDAYDNYVATVKRNIDKAVAEGILKDDCTEGYSYMSKETWLCTQADQEAQDFDTFGENKI
jgi:hypothetical protein